MDIAQTKEQQDKKQGFSIHQLRERMVAYIAGAFGIIAALAWNEAIKSFIEYLFPLTKDTLLMKFIYAIVLTVIVGYIATYLVQMIGKEPEQTPEGQKKVV